MTGIIGEVNEKQRGWRAFSRIDHLALALASTELVAGAGA
jgi:hypothetical protein